MRKDCTGFPSKAAPASSPSDQTGGETTCPACGGADPSGSDSGPYCGTCDSEGVVDAGTAFEWRKEVASLRATVEEAAQRREFWKRIAEERTATVERLEGERDEACGEDDELVMLLGGLEDALAVEREKVAAFEREVARLREALEPVTAAVGCGDHSCLFKTPTGMGTNGGCRCVRKPGVPEKLAALYRAALASSPTERPDNG